MSNPSSTDFPKAGDIDGGGGTNLKKGLRVSAVYREIDGQPGLNEDEAATLSRLREEIQKHDENKDGEIDAAEMVAILRNVIKSHDQKKVLHKIIYGVITLVVLLALATLGTGIAVASLTRKLSSDENRFAGPALVSASSGKMLSTRPEGSGGSNIFIAAFYTAYVDSEERIPYRTLIEIPAERSPTGNDLQCAGLMLHSVANRAIYNAENTASPIRFTYQIEHQPEFASFQFPAANIEHVPDTRKSNTPSRRRLESTMKANAEAAGNINISRAQRYIPDDADNSIPTSICQANEMVDYAAMAETITGNSNQMGVVSGSAGSGAIRISYPGSRSQNNPGRRRRRRLAAEAFANPLSAPWYEFMGDSGPPSITIVCNPDITGTPAFCYFCSDETSVQLADVPGTETR